MRRLFLVLSLAATTAWASGSGAQTRPPPPATTPPPPVASPATAPAPPAPTPGDKLFADALRAYHTALLSRRLGQQDLRKEDVAARVAEGEQLMASGRVDEAIAR